MAKAASQKVKMFRCHLDPMIGPKARNAFVMGTEAGQLPGSAELTAIGVKVDLLPVKGAAVGRSYLVPFANVQCVEIEPVVEDKEAA